jgi:glutamate/tyrosine decarboxylase-like PLP-dependent enzyme
MYVISPIAGKLEKVVEQWLKSIFKLPPETAAGFVSGTSTANLCGLASARFRLLKNQGWDINQKGLLNAPPIRIIAGKEAHSTVIKTIGLLGFGHDNIEFIDTDAQGRIRTDLIPDLDNNTLLILAAGNVNSGSFDNFSEICERSKQAGAWVHIDGAFGLWAGAVEKLRHLTNGIQYANSWAVDGHKTLNTPYDCGIILCNDKEALTSALHMSGGYLVLSDDRDGMFYTPEMSRRARIIELWATLKFLGTSGIDQMVYGLYERAKQFATELSSIDGFTIMNEIVFNQVVVTCSTDEITNQVIEEIQKERVCWVGGSTWKGRRVIRISVCSWTTTEDDVSLSVQSFQRALEKFIKT